MLLQLLFEGPVGAALCVWAGPGVCNGHEVVACDASRQMPQNAEGLLCPENALFHKVGSMSDHFVRRLFAAFFLNATSYFRHASPECSCSARAIVCMYSKRSGPLDGSAVAITVA